MLDVQSLKYTYDCNEYEFQGKNINPILNVNTIPLYKHGIKSTRSNTSMLQNKKSYLQLL